jgi:hypothetical protein
MNKEYEGLQYAENEFFRAYSLALKAAGNNEGTITLVEKIRTEADLQGSELYAELQDGIKAASMQASQSEASDFNRDQTDKIENEIEFLRKKYAVKRIAVLEATTIQLRTIALGRF